MAAVSRWPALPGSSRAALERRGDAAVQLGALAGQQVVGDDLALQGVAEGVRPLAAGHDEVRGDRLAQRLAQRARLQVARLLQQRVVRALGHRQQPQDLLGVLGRALQADHERVAQGRGQRAAAVGAGGQQLLHEQRVALAARPQALHEVTPRRRAEDLPDRRLEGLRAERLELDAPHLRQLGQQRAQRVAAVQLVRAVAGDRQHALGAQAARQEG